jgi:hypothetical protein
MIGQYNPEKVFTGSILVYNDYDASVDTAADFFLQPGPHLLSTTARGTAKTMMIAKTPKHHPDPVASARGC